MLTVHEILICEVALQVNARAEVVERAIAAGGNARENPYLVGTSAYTAWAAYQASQDAVKRFLLGLTQQTDETRAALREMGIGLPCGE